jgi:sporulation protein YlmC with PRC-barrel domain
MYKLSDIISKQAISLRGAQLLGTVSDVRFAPTLKKADALLLIDGEENDDGYLTLPAKAVSTMKEDSVVVRALSSPLTLSALPPNNPINLPCLNQDGKMLGRLSDITFDDKFAVVAFVVGESEYAADTLLSYSSSLVIFNDSGAPIKLPRARPNPKPSDKKTVVKTAFVPASPPLTEQAPAIENPTETEEKTSVTTPTAAPSPAPDFGTPDFSFLLGKCVTKTLCAASGRIIAAAGEIVTEQIIADATRENKLVQLTLRAY